MGTPFFNLRLSDEDRGRLTELAEDRELSSSMWLRLVIREKYEELVDARDARSAKKGGRRGSASNGR